ncbi:ATP-binding protein [uncultured Chitinophaga sp.]|uniref:ATP-binding protein n=1 Tax=uncultured Chitinophaga sp. TaxID=339340 RepID=UPI0025E5DF5E|nr:ATP-binding protein [uncultured Chitinophaga sp.]
MHDKDLRRRIQELEAENALLRGKATLAPAETTVKVPSSMAPLFSQAEATARAYFSNIKMDPGKGTIEISNERYVLIRASALSKDFLDSVLQLYADREATEAWSIGRNFLFDIAHAIGMNDARQFHTKMQLTDPIARLSAGPVHFAYTGWAFVDILPESNPVANDDFYLIYNHPYSFEADAWKRSGVTSHSPVCIMNAGYSSGWCQESFGIALTAVEVSCTATGDKTCTFIMAPPHRLEAHVEQYRQQHKKQPASRHATSDIPAFFQRKKAEEELQKARQLAEDSSKAKSDFLANMSHELRTPLGAILGYTDLLKKTKLHYTQQQYLDAIHTSGSNLLSIINDILDLSQLDAQKISLTEDPTDIPALLHSVQTMLASKARDKHLGLRCHNDPALNFPVLADALRLTQVLTNLIGNAIKFTEKGGISVRCKLISQTDKEAIVNIRIADTGIGIPPEKQQLVFERFTQAESAITRQYGGTGLGLAITRQLVALQGGDISLKSTVGKGSIFNIRLPLRKAVIKTQKVTETPCAAKGNNRRILVVEDNLLNQQMTKVLLASNGFKVRVAGNGFKALGILKKHTFDLILMDLQIPQMDGYVTTEKIRTELGLQTPVVAITAHALSGEKARCLKAGMNDYLSKPFREHDLLAVIDRNCTSTITDLTFLHQQTHSNTRLMKKMMQTFMQQLPQDLQQLDTAIQENNAPAVYKLAHSMRSSIAFFGWQRHIGDALLQLEKKAYAGVVGAPARKRFDAVNTCCQAGLKEITQLSQQL